MSGACNDAGVVATSKVHKTAMLVLVSTRIDLLDFRFFLIYDVTVEFIM
jgi:hypothetical protein